MKPVMRRARAGQSANLQLHATTRMSGYRSVCAARFGEPAKLEARHQRCQDTEPMRTHLDRGRTPQVQRLDVGRHPGAVRRHAVLLERPDPAVHLRCQGKRGYQSGVSRNVLSIRGRLSLVWTPCMTLSSHIVSGPSATNACTALAEAQYCPAKPPRLATERRSTSSSRLRSKIHSLAKGAHGPRASSTVALKCGGARCGPEPLS